MFVHINIYAYSDDMQIASSGIEFAFPYTHTYVCVCIYAFMYL